MPQRPGGHPFRRPAPKPPKGGRPEGADRDDDDDKGDKRFGKKRPNRWLDPWGVPSSYHMDQMIPFGEEFDRIFPRFHPSWLQRVQTPIPRVSAYPLHFRGFNPGGPHPMGGQHGGRR